MVEMTSSEGLGAAESMRHPQRGPFAGLLIAQLLFVGLLPFMSDRGTGYFFQGLGITAIVLAGVYAASRTRTARAISAVTVVLTFYAWWGPDLLMETYDDLLRLESAAISYGFTAFVVIRALMVQERVSLDTILGGINAYLLIATAFMLMHAGLIILDRGAYAIQGQPLGDVLLNAEESTGLLTLLYFSYATLTTLGYGDIVPISPEARILSGLEAILGQLYVAIFIGHLVGLQVSERVQRSNPHETERKT